MTRYIGLDIHKRQVTFCFLDRDKRVLQQGRILCTREDLTSFATAILEPTDRLALEATTHTWAVVDILEPHVEQIVVSNPLRTRAIAEAKIKTDKIDSRVLAELLASGYLPQVWQPDQQTRRLRGLSHRRASLVADRTAIKNRLHSILAMRLVQIPFSTLWSKKGRAWLEQVELDPDGRQALDSDLRLLDTIEQEIEQLELLMAKSAYPDEQTRLLMTLPGFGLAVAQGLRAAWGDPTRFPSADKAASYLGLVPSTRQSDLRCYHGRITKQGNCHARWLLVQAAQHVDRHPGPLGVFFRRLVKRKNRNVAVVATARKLATIAWHMLRHREPYRYALPKSTEQKLAQLRVQVTGKKRKGGMPKGTPRPKNYGQGNPTRAIPSLQQICQREQLPEPKTANDISAGERRVLIRTKTLQHANCIQESRREPRAKAKKPAESS